MAPQPITPARAYKLGWNASSRPGHDLERDEQKFLNKHGDEWWISWLIGWEDYALGHDFGSHS